MNERDDLIMRVVETLKEPVRLAEDFDRRVMAEVRAGPAPKADVHPVHRAYRWLRTARPVMVSPLGGLAMAAVLTGVVLIGRAQLAVPTRDTNETPAQLVPVSAARTGETIQFVLVAPAATSVALLGDFNDWNADLTPMRSTDGGGVWSVTVPLTPGRYRYVFLVDGEQWVPDPTAPPALDDDFGRPNSVLTIGGS
jgi:Carbohydrate-binding module 48 (Isoamylase N-terminal domain)